MSDNGASHFNASKPNRNAAFSYRNDVNLDSEIAGNQESRWFPTPQVLGNSQKVGLGDQEPSPELASGRTAGRVIPPTSTPDTAYNRG